jgi:hypothetical protein
MECTEGIEVASNWISMEGDENNILKAFRYNLQHGDVVRACQFLVDE